MPRSSKGKQACSGGAFNVHSIVGAFNALPRTFTHTVLPALFDPRAPKPKSSLIGVAHVPSRGDGASIHTLPAYLVWSVWCGSRGDGASIHTLPA